MQPCVAGDRLSAKSFGMNRTQCTTAKIETNLAVNALLPSQSPCVRQERKKKKNEKRLFLVSQSMDSMVFVCNHGQEGKGKILESKPSELALVN